MSGNVLIPERTARDIKVFAEFFGIDMEWSRHIFRHPAQADARAFEVVMRAFAEAIEQDKRYGTTRRIRESIVREKARR